MELYGKTEVAARSRQLAALLHGCNPPQGWPVSAMVNTLACPSRYNLQLLILVQHILPVLNNTSEIILYAFCKFGEFLLGYSVRFLTCNPLARKFVY